MEQLSIRVEILLPKKLFSKVRYRLLQSINLCGVTVPIGFVSDGASVPRLLWFIFPPVGRYFQAAVVHDWLLANNHPWMKANKLFLQALKEQGIPWCARYPMYGATVLWKGLVTGYRSIKKRIEELQG
jgi:hypothetical protein